MTLPTRADAKSYLRIPNGITAEDGLIDQLLARAKALVVGYLGRPLMGVQRTFTQLTPITPEDTYDSVLVLPEYPVARDPAIVVTDANGATVLASDYVLEAARGWIRTIPMLYWGTAPYTVVANVGLQYHPDWATVIEPAIGAAIIDVVSDLYQRRNPLAQQEGSAGSYVGWSSLAALSPRVEESLKPWRRPPRV